MKKIIIKEKISYGAKIKSHKLTDYTEQTCGCGLSGEHICPLKKDEDL